MNLNIFFILSYMEQVLGKDQKSLVDAVQDKSLTIQTVRMVEDRELFRSYISLKGITSFLISSHPFGSSDELKKSILKTLWHKDGDGIFWRSYFGHKELYMSETKKFGHLQEAFSSYSEERLKQWEKEAIDRHYRLLRNLEAIYWEGNPLSPHFFDEN